jgi:hypothetical protein
VLRDLFRQYWLHALALAVCVCATIRYWQLGDYFETTRLRLMIFAFGGFVAVVTSEEFSEWTGRYGLTRAQWLMTPDWFIRFVGGISLLYCTIALYRL